MSDEEKTAALEAWHRHWRKFHDTEPDETIRGHYLWGYRAGRVHERRDPATIVERSLEAFTEAILHGDEQHRAWLKQACAAFITGAPMPKPTGTAVDARPQCIACGVCAIAGCQKPATESDHDHATGKPRELLCKWHNTRIEVFERGEDTAAMLEYLNKHSGAL